jgi:hypothetical protein
MGGGPGSGPLFRHIAADIVTVRVVLSWILLREIDAARAEAERGRKGP